MDSIRTLIAACLTALLTIIGIALYIRVILHMLLERDHNATKHAKTKKPAKAVKNKRVPKGYHRMPDGSIMKGSRHK